MQRQILIYLLVMRFIDDGPVFPDELLTARDDGQVLFFCGAGVSRAKAGLPDFYGLADLVVDALRASPNSPARRLIEAARKQEQIAGVGGLLPADRVFALLERDFLVADVRAAVAQALRTGPGVDLAAHRTILELARDPTGVVRLVTTNFDLLFEACDAALARRAPPSLPDPRRPRDFHGVMHLHGHVTDGYDAAHDDEFVLSSADFGRAYLSDGWATRFIRSLIDHYRLVFVGYAADDPPVHYLLEALNRDGERGAELYAFQSGDDENATALWEHKGVRAIAYDPADGHAQLWRSLEAWAERARNPAAWTAGVLNAAKAGPRPLTPVQRGQVRHIISTASGAHAFSDAAPSAEWLCCFDARARYTPPFKAASGDGVVDLFEAYGLDDDVPPPATNPDNPLVERRVPDGAWDGLVANKNERQDLAPEQAGALRGHWALGAPNLTQRLRWLAIWLGQVCDQPAAAWWAAGQAGLHPDARSLIRRRLQDLPQPSAAIEQAWRYTLRGWEAPRRGDMEWMELEIEIRRAGWTSSTLQAWADLIRPYVKTRRPLMRTEPPPPRPDLKRDDVVDLDLEFPEIERHVPFPVDQLPRVAAALRGALDVGIDLSLETRGYEGLPVPPIEADPNLTGESFGRTYGIAALFFDYVDTLQRLVAAAPGAAQKEIAAWRSDSTMFNRLRIWAAGRKDFMGPAEAARALLALDRDTFWSGDNQRDLLVALERRWGEFPASLRRRLERRLLTGPRLGRGTPSERRERRAHRMLSRLMWLQNRGCAVSVDLDPILTSLRAEAPQWIDAYAERAADSMEGRSGWVGRDPSTRGLEFEPPARLLARAAELGGHDYDRMIDRVPLAGIAETKPARFLRALGVAAMRGEGQPKAWETFLLSEARSKDRDRLAQAIGLRLLKLPEPIFAGIALSVAEWMLRLAAPLQARAPDIFEALWDALLAVFRAHPETTDSGMLHSAGHDWAGHALNAPGGKLAQALLKDPAVQNGGLSVSWLRRAECLLAVDGAVRCDALVMFAHHVRWFYLHAAAWTTEHLLSVLGDGGEDEKAFWAGFFWAARFPGFELYSRLKPHLLAMAASLRGRGGHLEVLAGLILGGWGSIDESTGRSAVSDDELREVLRSGGEPTRGQMLWQLQAWSRDAESEWCDKRLRLLRDVWPRERAARSPDVSEHLFELAVEADPADFPALVDVVTPLMTPVSQRALGMVSLAQKDGKAETLDGLALLTLVFTALPADASQWPYGADSVVGVLARRAETAQDARTVELRRRLAAR